MNIIMATSNLYSHPALITIRSLLMNNQDCDEITIHYIGNGLSEQSRSMIRDLVGEFDREVVFYSMPEDYNDISGLTRTDPVVYSYCFFQDILPDSLDRALLIESDTIVMSSLQELYSTDLDGYCLAMADDLQSRWYKRKLRLKDDSVYYNCGVMLVNLTELRNVGFSQMIWNIIKEGRSKFFYEVQDELNVALEGRIKTLHPKYNCTTALFLFDYNNMIRYRRPSTKCTEAEFEEARDHPVIIHYTKNQIIQSRPWLKECHHPYNGYYLDIKESTAIADEPLWDSGRSWINETAFFFYSRVSKSFTAWILGIIHSYLYPVILYRFILR